MPHSSVSVPPHIAFVAGLGALQGCPVLVSSPVSSQHGNDLNACSLEAMAGATGRHSSHPAGGRS